MNYDEIGWRQCTRSHSEARQYGDGKCSRIGGGRVKVREIHPLMKDIQIVAAVASTFWALVGNEPTADYAV